MPIWNKFLVSRVPTIWCHEYGQTGLYTPDANIIMTLVCDTLFDTCLWYAICITCSVFLFLSMQEFRFLRTLSLSSASSPKRISPPRTDGMCAVGGHLYALCSVYNPTGVQIFYSVLLILAEPWPSMCMYDTGFLSPSRVKIFSWWQPVHGTWRGGGGRGPHGHVSCELTANLLHWCAVNSIQRLWSTAEISVFIQQWHCNGPEPLLYKLHVHEGDRGYVFSLAFDMLAICNSSLSGPEQTSCVNILTQ